MITFKEARAAVTARYGAETLLEGWQDKTAFCVALSDPPLVDLVIYVEKASGQIVEKPYNTETERLQGMLDVAEFEETSKEEGPA